MNTRIRTGWLSLVFTILTLPITVSASEVEMSAVEQEAWGVIESYWKDYADKNPRAWTYFAKNYTVWSIGNPIPVSTSTFSSWETYYAKTSTVDKYELFPVHVQAVSDDVVVVHYFVGHINIDDEGNAGNTEPAHWTEVLQKVNGEWKLSGGGGGSPDWRGLW